GLAPATAASPKAAPKTELRIHRTCITSLPWMLRRESATRAGESDELPSPESENSARWYRAASESPSEPSERLLRLRARPCPGPRRPRAPVWRDRARRTRTGPGIDPRPRAEPD